MTSGLRTVRQSLVEDAHVARLSGLTREAWIERAVNDLGVRQLYLRHGKSLQLRREVEAIADMHWV